MLRQMNGPETSGGRSVWRSIGRVGFVLLALAGFAAPASAHVLPEDAAATHAYLTATNKFEEAEMAGLSQETAAREATVAGIAGECPGVLTNSPPHEEVLGFGLIGPASQARPSPRAEGERRRQSRQLGDLKLELSLALAGSRTQASREAALALIHALMPLKWSDGKITFLLHLTVEEVQEELDLPAPPVCADMKAWVASGYKALSPASKELASQSETLLKRTFELVALVTQVPIQPFPKNLAPYENAADRALARHTEALTVQLKKGRETQNAVVKRIEATVGLPPTKPLKKTKRPATKPVVIARGRTAAGGSFVAKAELSPHTLRGSHCTAEVSITEPSRPSSGGLLELLNGNSPDRCLSRSAHVDPQQSVHCNAGLLTVEADLPATVTSVRLLLGEHRTITSKAIRVPRRLGGPADLYYQVVRGPSPIPVSLTELDAHGNTLAVLKLPAVVQCTKKLVKYFPGGLVELAHGNLPAGPSFSIRAERYRELGQIHFKLKFTASNEESLTGSGGGDLLESTGAAEAEGSSLVFSGRPIQQPQAFERQTSSGCVPQPYAIIYGILRAPGDTVLARVSGTLIALNKVPIPARLHAGGVLAYGAFSPIPTELLTRDASGKIVSVDSNFATAAKTTIETCEGEAEGS
jgi:hypothetical protein